MAEYSSGNKYSIIAKIEFGQPYLDNYLRNDSVNALLICTMRVESIVTLEMHILSISGSLTLIVTSSYRCLV